MYESLSEFDDDDVTPTRDVVKEFQTWLKLDVIQELLQNKVVGGARNTNKKGKRTKCKSKTKQKRKKTEKNKSRGKDKHLLIKM